jgi:hypothetical protein
VIEQMKNFAIAKSVSEGKRIYYGIIDGYDTQRLIAAYQKYFREVITEVKNATKITYLG